MHCCEILYFWGFLIPLTFEPRYGSLSSSTSFLSSSSLSLSSSSSSLSSSSLSASTWALSQEFLIRLAFDPGPCLDVKKVKFLKKLISFYVVKSNFWYALHLSLALAWMPPLLKPFLSNRQQSELSALCFVKPSKRIFSRNSNNM